jgi:hypothetical protein
MNREHLLHISFTTENSCAVVFQSPEQLSARRAIRSFWSMPQNPNGLSDILDPRRRPSARHGLRL